MSTSECFMLKQPSHEIERDWSSWNTSWKKQACLLVAGTVWLENLALSENSFITGVCYSSLEEAWQPSPVFLSGESYGQWSLGATVHGVAESDKIDVTERAKAIYSYFKIFSIHYAENYLLVYRI